MAQIQNNSSHEKSKNSFLNEVRGRLLEFSCAQSLAIMAKKQHVFFNSISQGNLSELQQYQDYLRETDIHSYNYIQEAGNNFCEYFKDVDISFLDNILLTGKDQNKHEFHEADLAIKIKKRTELYSIKLIKNNSFINTKSAGVKSIFEKYFNSQPLQDKFNEKVDLYFNQFKIDFFNHYDCPLDEMSFSELLTKNNLVDRPGQLPEELKPYLYSFYKKSILYIHQHFKQMYSEQPERFISNLSPLIGFGNERIKVITFYHDSQFKKVYSDFHEYKDIITSEIRILNISGNTSFIIEMDNLLLQIRVKPMNSFLAPSMKVNCSVKFKGDN
jgi:hypothetical protein